MKQLQIREPWAGLAYGSDQQIVADLLARIQVLERRLKELEEVVSQRSEEREPVAV